MTRPTARLQLGTTFDIVTYAAIVLLLELEGSSAANALFRRLVRNELDRRLPGAWQRLEDARASVSAELAPREQAVALADVAR
jgi:hypothetical protein